MGRGGYEASEMGEKVAFESVREVAGGMGTEVASVMRECMVARLG